MSPDRNDNPDKTVFRQPVNRGNGTVVRPMPGGRPLSGQPSMPSAPAQPQQPVYRQPTQSAHPQTVDVGSYTGSFKTAWGLNPLVNAAAVLLAVFSKTRQSINHPNVGGLHQHLETEIKTFDRAARDAGIKGDMVLVARYILCTILDEAVLNTPWGAESAWTQKTLLSMFHNETGGGEKFFVILDRMRQSPAENLDFLELIYICISLGYEGKYRVVSRGRDSLERLRDELFQIIRTHRGEYERALSPSWRGLGQIRNTLASYMPMWVIASILGGIMALSYSGFRYWLHESTSYVAEQLTEISKTDITAKPNRLDTNK